MKRSFDDCVSEVSSSSSYEPNGMMLMTTSIADNINANTSINYFSNNFNSSDNLFMDHTIINEEDSSNTQNDDMYLLVGMAQKKIKKNSSLPYYRNHDNYRYQPSLLTMNGCLGMKTSQSEFELIGCIGSYGSQNGQFKNPSDVAIDFTNQLVFVVDTDNRRIQVFDESTLTFKYMFVTPYKPNAVTVHWDHTLIISFTRDSMICKYDFNGNEIWSWGGISTKNIMDSPTGVVVDYEGNIYVCDWFLHQILVFSPSGELLRSIGSVGKENGQLSFPRDIDMDSAGNIVVSDSGNNRIQILKSNGEFISSFGSLGNDKGEFQAPNSVFVDKSTGNIFLTEWDSHRISKFHPSNPFLGSTCIGSYGNLENSLKYPSGIAFCYGSSRLFCVDCGNSRIKVYRVA